LARVRQPRGVRKSQKPQVVRGNLISVAITEFIGGVPDNAINGVKAGWWDPSSVQPEKPRQLMSEILRLDASRATHQLE
jgi:hypothetical protein